MRLARDDLVVLASHAEHIELHRKMRVRAAGGDPWRDRLCGICGPQPTEQFYVNRSTHGKGFFQGRCKACLNRLRVIAAREQGWRKRA